MQPHLIAAGRQSGRFLGPVRVALYGASTAMVGGQAVMEGVMMRTPHHWAVAVRRADDSITVVERDITPFAARHAWAKLPVLRGVIALGESLGIGFRALNVSAQYAAEYFEEAEAPDAADDEAEGGAPDGAEPAAATEADAAEAPPDHLSAWQLALSFILAIGMAIGLFKLLPLVLTGLAVGSEQTLGFVMLEGAVRISIFIGYIALIGLIPDLKRVFQYHSAEHKSINALEAGVPLEPTDANRMSRIHVRCGTAFLLWVFVVAVLVFGIYGWLRNDPGLVELVLSRIVLLPVIAGMSFELIRWAGKHPHNRIIRAVLAPGLWLQYLTTRPCTEPQCEVAIASLNSVLERERVTADDDAWGRPRAAAEDDEDEPIEVMA